LKPGERAVVVRIDIPPDQRGRLMEMGLLPGTPLELVRFAPLGDPVEIKLRNYHLSLRRLEAEKIQVG
jgi:Fe2+ transport system protein FeoA